MKLFETTPENNVAANSGRFGAALRVNVKSPRVPMLSACPTQAICDAVAGTAFFFGTANTLGTIFGGHRQRFPSPLLRWCCSCGGDTPAPRDVRQVGVCL